MNIIRTFSTMSTPSFSDTVICQNCQKMSGYPACSDLATSPLRADEASARTS